MTRRVSYAELIEDGVPPLRGDIVVDLVDPNREATVVDWTPQWDPIVVGPSLEPQTWQADQCYLRCRHYHYVDTHGVPYLCKTVPVAWRTQPDGRPPQVTADPAVAAEWRSLGWTVSPLVVGPRVLG